jgi:hypothetical protein
MIRLGRVAVKGSPDQLVLSYAGLLLDLMSDAGLTIVGLGLVIWTVGLRPPEARPRWFRWYGLLLTAFPIAVGLLRRSPGHPAPVERGTSAQHRLQSREPFR